MEASPESAATIGIEEVMVRLSLSRAEVYRKVMDKLLSATKAAGVLRFLEKDVSAYAAAHVEAQAQFEAALKHWLDFFGSRLAGHGVVELPDVSEVTTDEKATELARRLVVDGMLSNVDDLYVDPLHSGDRVLLRSDGRLSELCLLEASVSTLLKGKLKALAPLPEDGGVGQAVFRQTHDGREYQIRLTVVPSLLGEHLHLLFYDSQDAPTLESLGYSSAQGVCLRSLLSGRPGLFLMVGAADPTGGRHRLALADLLSTTGRLVVSLEHRIQYRSELLVQLEIRAEDGDANATVENGFDALWRMALGMGPDVLFIDEVRNAGEAQSLPEAVHAGSLVVAQVRAAGGVEALVQLRDYELNRDGLARSLLGLVERMGMRRLCGHCRARRPVEADEAALLDVSEDAAVWEARGCDVCGDGYFGRRMLYGVWVMDESLAALVRSPEGVVEGLEAWRDSNAFSLGHAAREAVLAGDITVDDARPWLSACVV